VFHGQLTHRTTCLVCQTETDSEGPFWHLPLDLEESSRNYSVENGIKMFFTPTIFDGENQMYCDNCDVKVDATRKYVIIHHPDVLLLMLKRFDFSYKHMSYIKINCYADVPHTLRVPENQTYELYAVVEHCGDLRGGHYKAIIRPKDEEVQWYIFNDTNVTPLGQNPFPDNVNIVNSKDAYLLFYRKKDSCSVDSCSDKDNHLCTTQDSDQSQKEENLQGGDNTETLNENFSDMDDRAQNACNIKPVNDKGRILDCLLTEAKPESKHLGDGELNESETHSRKKHTKGRAQDKTRSSYAQDITEDAQRDEETENRTVLSAKDQTQGHNAGRIEDAAAVDDAENNKPLPPENLPHYSKNTEQTMSGNIQADVISNNNQAESAVLNEQEKLNESQRKEESDFSELFYDNERSNNLSQRLLSQDGLHHDDDGPKVDESGESKQKDDQRQITGNSERNKNGLGKKENTENTDRIGKYLSSHRKDKRLKPYENSQARKRVKHKVEYSDSPAQSYHDERPEDLQMGRHGQDVHSVYDAQKKLDLKKTMKNNNKIGPMLTGNQGAERDEETSQEKVQADTSKGLQGATAGGHSSKQSGLDCKTLEVDIWEVSPSGRRKKKIQIKTTVEEISHNSIKRKEKNNEKHIKRNSDEVEERITPSDPLLFEHQDHTLKEVARDANKDEYRQNFSPDAEFETCQNKHAKDKNKCSCQCTCVCL
ncbi:hypothetical protein GOODEAATRI_019557, partial [Goodea atripinnis]